MTHHHCTLFIMLASFLAASGVTVPYPPEVQALLHTLEDGSRAVIKYADEAALAGECAGYKASLFLGFPPVPPTTLRVIDGKQWMIQPFIDNTLSSHDLLHEAECAMAHQDEIANLILFSFVMGQ